MENSGHTPIMIAYRFEPQRTTDVAAIAGLLLLDSARPRRFESSCPLRLNGALRSRRSRMSPALRRCSSVFTSRNRGRARIGRTALVVSASLALLSACSSDSPTPADPERVARTPGSRAPRRQQACRASRARLKRRAALRARLAERPRAERPRLRARRWSAGQPGSAERLGRALARAAAAPPGVRVPVRPWSRIRAPIVPSLHCRSRARCPRSISCPTPSRSSTAHASRPKPTGAVAGRRSGRKPRSTSSARSRPPTW